jgi:hypothetical protein
MAWYDFSQLSTFTQLATSRLLGNIVGNLLHLRTPPQHIYTRDPALGNLSFNNTAYADVDATNMKPTLTFTGNPVEVTFSAGSVSVNAVDLVLTLTVDGVDIGISTTGLTLWEGVNSQFFRYIITGLSAGSHTIALQSKVAAAGTVTLSATRHIQFMVKEM